LYRPTNGNVLVNGNDITSYNRDEYYTLISAAFQEIYVLPISIAKNIALCNDVNIDRERVKNVLVLSGLFQKVSSLIKGIDTFLLKAIHEEATELSGGEMQKLALARALYKNGKMIVLDEPTAALDPIAENEMYLKYNELTNNRSSIFISHRLSSTRFCDRIFFLENGKIIEEGSHNKLISINGRYAEMFGIQSYYYKKEAFINEQ
jgi:ABC-type multidrug transport system fused ATPase/permease subunit